MEDPSNIAQSGINPETGEYLSAEERKELFKKGKIKSVIKYGSFTGTKNSSIARFVSETKKSTNEKELEKKELEEIKTVGHEILSVKKDRQRLSDLFERRKLQSSKRQYRKETPKTEKTLSGVVRRKAVSFFGGIFGLLGDLLSFTALRWIADPKNKATVTLFVSVIKDLFKFFDWFITGVVDNLFSGFAELVGGDSLLEKIGGAFKLLFGFIGLRWLLRPGKLIKDLRFAIKNSKTIFRILRDLTKFNFKGALVNFNKLLAATGKSVLKRGIGRAVKRILLKIFGKGIAKMIKPLTKIIAKTTGSVVRRVPFVGPLVGIAIDLAFGEPIDTAAVRAAGSIAGSAIGASLAGVIGGILGSVVPVIGNLLLGSAGATAGGVVGSFVGEWLASTIYEGAKGLFGGSKTEDTPQLAEGGVAIGPKSGFLAVLHGTEVVIPIAKIGEILGQPFTVLGRGLIGSLFALLDSLGPVGAFVRPFAKSLLAPQIKLFGMDEYEYNTDVGEIKGSPEAVSRGLESKKKKKDEEEKKKKDKGFFGKIMSGIKNFLNGVKGIVGGVFDALTGDPANAATRDPSLPDGGGSFDSPGQATGAVDPSTLYSSMGFTREDWDLFRNTVAKIESGGKYDIAGGSGRRYDGRYQMGAAAKTDGARYAGVPDPGHSAAARERFRKDPQLQETLFAGYTKANHTYLMRNPKYKNASPQRKLQILGYAHNQGMDGAEKWLNTGVVGADGFGTKGTKYTDAIAAEFRKRGKTPVKPTTSQSQPAQAQQLIQTKPDQKGTYHKPDEPSEKDKGSTPQTKIQPVSSVMKPTSGQQAKSAVVQISNESAYRRRVNARRSTPGSVVISNSTFNTLNNTVATIDLNRTNNLSDTGVLNRL